jgi:hypothetical protein
MERVQKLLKSETYDKELKDPILHGSSISILLSPLRIIVCYANADHAGLCSIEIRRPEMAYSPYRIS